MSSNRIILAVCAVVVFALVGVLGSALLPVVIYRFLIDGSFCLAWLLACAGVGAGVLRIIRKSEPGVLPHIVISTAVGIGMVGTIVLGLGLAGLLNSATVWGLVIVGVALAIWLLTLPLVNGWRAARDRSSSWNWLWLLAMPSLAVALIGALVPPFVLWGDEPHGYDVAAYHLQVPREWYEAGRISALEHNVYSYLPMQVEVHYLLAMHLRGGPWAGMYLAQLIHVAMTAMSVVAVYALTRSVIAGVAMAVAPWLLLLAPIAYNEGGLLLFGALAAGLVWRAIRDQEHSTTRDWLLAGACAGFACSVKLTAGPMLLAAVPLCALVATRNLRLLATFVVAALVTFSPWMIRNVAWTRNPFFPEATRVFGQGTFTDAQQERWSAAHSPRPDQRAIVGRLSAMGHQIVWDWRFGYLLMPAALVAVALSRKRQEWFLLALLSMLAIVWLLFTHLQSRFFVLAVPVAALAISGVNDRRWRGGFAVAVVAMMLAGWINWSLRYYSAPERQGLFRVALSTLAVDSLEGLTPEEAIDVRGDETLVLVGDARAFLYRRPMSRLRYRTVFDVRDHWIDPNQPADAVILFDPTEVRRFVEAYHALPAPPFEISDVARPFLMRRDSSTQSVR